MNFLRKILFSVIFSGFVSFAFSQETEPAPLSPPSSQQGELNVIYRNELTGGILAHSNGFGINYRRSKHTAWYRKRVVEFEFVSMKNVKEYKSVNPYYENSRGFFYGKLYTFQVFRPGVGFQHVLFRRAERKSVEIRYITMLGASIGFAKPIYLEILKPTSNPYEKDLITERYDPDKHSLIDIYGRAPFFKGIDETNIFPGGYAKFGLSFEFGEQRTDVKAIETGVTLDVFHRVVPMMAYTKNNQAFFNFYISFVFGKKWF